MGGVLCCVGVVYFVIVGRIVEVLYGDFLGDVCLE